MRGGKKIAHPLKTLNVSDGDFDMGAAQEVEAHQDMVLAVERHRLAFEAAEGTLDDTDGVARLEGRRAEGDGFGTVVEHEAEALHLLVGDDGRRALAAQHHVAQDGGQRQRKGTFQGRDVHEDEHGKHQTVYPLAAVAPLVDLALDGQVALDAHGPETLDRLLLHARLDVGHQPLAGGGITCASAVRIRLHNRNHIRISCHNRSSGRTCRSRSSSHTSSASCPDR